VARRWLVVLAAVVAVAVAVAVAVVSQRGGAAPAKQSPEQAKPSQQVGDTADLMRRLERKQIAKESR
jgi:flagellar basal body-associated protein FliL